MSSLQPPHCQPLFAFGCFLVLPHLHPGILFWLHWWVNSCVMAAELMAWMKAVSRVAEMKWGHILRFVDRIILGISFQLIFSTASPSLTIIPQAHVEYDLARTSASGIIVLFNAPKNLRTLILFVEHGIMARDPWWLSQWIVWNCSIQWSSF